MADPRDCSALLADRVDAVGEVVARLSEIRACTEKVAPGCGISQFSGLYLTITENIQAKIKAKTFFDDDAYLTSLDVAFANRYFDALRSWARREETPRVWAMLFDCPGGSALQLAAAGVNAHINFDLAVAVVDTGWNIEDDDLTAREADYLKVNEVFAEEMDILLSRLRDGGDGIDDDPTRLSVLGQLVSHAVNAARWYAWETAEDLWLLQRNSSEWKRKERHMDAAAAFFGETLLKI